jgi:PKD repeat protein
MNPRTLLLLVLIFCLLSVPASAACTVTKTPLGAGHPPATQFLVYGINRIDYTGSAASCSDPLIVQFKDLSRGNETYIRWDFGDGTSLQGTKITPALKNPVHKYKKPGHYISCLTIKCQGYRGKLWVHKTVVIR